MRGLHPYLKEKIRELGTGILYSFQSGVLHIPNSLIRVVKVEDEGVLWFQVHRPYWDMSEFDLFFPCRLQLYNKRCNYYITLEGLSMIPELQHSTGVEMRPGTCSYLWIRMEIRSINYFGKVTWRPFGWVEKLSVVLQRSAFRVKKMPEIQYR